MIGLPNYYFSINGKRKFEKELTFFFENVERLKADDDFKDFELFLKSPFLVKESKLTDLVAAIIKRAKRSKGMLQGGRIIEDLNLGDLDKGERQIKKLFKLFSKAVYDFYAFQYLRDNPTEKGRMTVRALSPKVYPKLYKDALLQYQSAVDKLSEGLNKSLHSYESSYWGHFSLSVSKEDDEAPAFIKLKQRTDNLANLIRLVFECEKQNRDNIWTHVDFPAKKTQTVELYEGLLSLLQQKEFDGVAYDNFSNGFLEYATKLEDREQLIFVTLLTNYLNQRFRDGTTETDHKVFELTQWQLRPNVYPAFRVLSRNWMLNQVSNACAVGRIDVAEKVKELHRKRIEHNKRKLTVLHATAILYFNQDQYKEAYSLITDKIHPHKLDPHTDSLRLKCFRLMSTLCLVIEDYSKWEDDYLLALNSFDVFFSRKHPSFHDERYDYYRNMVVIIRKMHSVWVKQGSLTDSFSEIRSMIQSTKKLHGRSWLLSLLWHFVPSAPPTLPVKPFKNQGLVPDAIYREHLR